MITMKWLLWSWTSVLFWLNIANRNMCPGMGLHVHRWSVHVWIPGESLHREASQSFRPACQKKKINVKNCWIPPRQNFQLGKKKKKERMCLRKPGHELFVPPGSCAKSLHRAVSPWINTQLLKQHLHTPETVHSSLSYSGGLLVTYCSLYFSL